MDFLSGTLLLVVKLLLVGVAAWALIDCAVRSQPAFVAAGKLTKPAWLGITAAAVLAALLSTLLTIFGIVAAIASIVYLVDVRPAVKEVQGGGRW